MTGLIHVFAGPSLPPAQRPQLAQVVFHTPATQGDVYRLVSSRPLAIAIIDGYFERVPAVWHKEILWALSQGVHVYGAASMGALRAAELLDFGMVGVGSVFDDFASGRLTDDDEVAIVHGDEAAGFRPGSEAMVNIRATVQAACEDGVIAEATRDALIRHAKSQFYPDRNYPEMLAWARERFSAREHEDLRARLVSERRRVDVKRTDSLALLDELIALRDGDVSAKQVPWSFQHTDAWETVRRRMRAHSQPWSTLSGGSRAEVLVELRADRGAHELAWQNAVARSVTIEQAKRDGFVPTSRDRDAALAELCRRHDLVTEQSLREWTAQQDLTESDFSRLLDDEACLRRQQVLRENGADDALLALLQATGAYGELKKKRARGAGRPEPRPRAPAAGARHGVGQLHGNCAKLNPSGASVREGNR